MKKLKCTCGCMTTLYVDTMLMEDGFDLICIGTDKSSKKKKIPNDLVVSRKELIKLLKDL